MLDKVGNRISEVLTGDVINSKTYSYNNRDQLTNIVDTQGLNVDYVNNHIKLYQKTLIEKYAA